MSSFPSNIVLIGMPGSGKSTVGVLLAKRLGKAFVDTDLLIQTVTGRSLQAIVDQDGHLALRSLEEQVLLDLDCRNMVIATGGSAVYSPQAMEHLKRDGIAVLLQVSLGTLRERVPDYGTRGLAKRRDQTLEDLFAERSALYARYADVTIDADGIGREEVCAGIIRALQASGSQR